MAPGALAVTIGQHSARGRKAENQDFHGALVPGRPDLDLKGVAVALADGIGSSRVGAVAAETAVKSFLDDYYATPSAWSVRTSAWRVIAATNSWLHAQTRAGPGRDDPDRGYVTTLSVLVLKGRTAHVFHVGDTRVGRLDGRGLERLTQDHRVVVSSVESYLGRALGADARVEIDHRALAVVPGDVFVLTSDGVHDHLRPGAIAAGIAAAEDLDAAARALVEAALAAGSPDNLTVQIVRVDALPEAGPGLDDLADEGGGLEPLAPAPLVEPPAVLDGYRVLRRLHASPRSHVYLAEAPDAGGLVALKVPATDLRDDPAALRRLAMEEWIARRIDNPHVIKAPPRTRRRSHLYTVTEYFEGETLTQWMADHRTPDLPAVRGIVEQIARGVQAFHRREMVHRDLRPDNVLVDASGTVRVIDFGAARVAGLAETEPEADEPILGTLQYTAPECFLGHPASAVSDVFAVGVIAYQMLTGRLPYGARVARIRTSADRRRLRYRPALTDRPGLPPWIDAALARAVHPDPDRRTPVLSELVADLRGPRAGAARPVPLLERDPLLFWRALSLGLALVVLILLAERVLHPPG